MKMFLQVEDSFVFNYFLEQSISSYKEEKITLRYKDYASMLVEMKKEYEFLKEVEFISALRRRHF